MFLKTDMISEIVTIFNTDFYTNAFSHNSIKHAILLGFKRVKSLFKQQIQIIDYYQMYSTTSIAVSNMDCF